MKVRVTYNEAGQKNLLRRDEVIECLRVADNYPEGRVSFYSTLKVAFADQIRSIALDQVADWSVLLNRHICTECGAAYHSEEDEATICNACTIKAIETKLALVEFKNGDSLCFPYSTFKGNPERRWEFFDHEGNSVGAYDSAYIKFMDLDYKKD